MHDPTTILRNKSHLEILANFIHFIQSSNIQWIKEELKLELLLKVFSKSYEIAPLESKNDYIKRKKLSINPDYNKDYVNFEFNYELAKGLDLELRNKGTLHYLVELANYSLNKFHLELEHQLLLATNPQNYKSDIEKKFSTINMKFSNWYSINLDEVKKFEPNSFESFEKILKETETIIKNVFRGSNETKKPIRLEGLFTHSDLQKLIQLLLDKKFIKRYDEGYKWTGIKDDKAKGIKLQIVALAEVCRPLYIKKEYFDKELHEAWTSFFRFKTSGTIWTKGKASTIADDYIRIFNFIKHSFRIN